MRVPGCRDRDVVDVSDGVDGMNQRQKRKITKLKNSKGNFDLDYQEIFGLPAISKSAKRVWKKIAIRKHGKVAMSGLL